VAVAGRLTARRGKGKHITPTELRERARSNTAATTATAIDSAHATFKPVPAKSGRTAASGPRALKVGQFAGFKAA
jgi:hypothetical protein